MLQMLDIAKFNLPGQSSTQGAVRPYGPGPDPSKLTAGGRGQESQVRDGDLRGRRGHVQQDNPTQQDMVQVPESGRTGAHVSRAEPSGAAVGWISFAGILLIIGGSFAMLAGLDGMINPDAFVVTKDNLIKVSTSTWGWWHLIVGAIVFFSGFGVFTGNVLARTGGVNRGDRQRDLAFVYMSVYPIWGITIVLIDFAIIWALTVHGRDIQKAERMGEM